MQLEMFKLIQLCIYWLLNTLCNSCFIQLFLNWIIFQKKKSRRFDKHCNVFVFVFTACPVKGQIRKDVVRDPHCPSTCDTVDGIMMGPCYRQDVRYGCECPDGKVIDEDKNECISPKDCGMFISTVCTYCTSIMLAFMNFSQQLLDCNAHIKTSPLLSSNPHTFNQKFC